MPRRVMSDLFYIDCLAGICLISPSEGFFRMHLLIVSDYLDPSTSVSTAVQITKEALREARFSFVFGLHVRLRRPLACGYDQAC